MLRGVYSASCINHTDWYVWYGEPARCDDGTGVLVETSPLDSLARIIRQAGRTRRFAGFAFVDGSAYS
jgi:hypothetical protein